MSLYEMTVPCFTQMLRSLQGFLKKGEARAQEVGFDPKNLLQSRLAPDMHNLASQVYFTCTQAQEAVLRLGRQPLSKADTPTDMEQAHALIEQTLHLLASTDRAQMEEAAQRPLAIELANGMAFDMTGSEYALNWVIPQFYFHLTTAYSILRHNGVPLGKADYVAHMLAYLRKPAA
ncbi:hypothetical protein A176_001651 [Myxococcus hansupus]|uniref:DUF1993 domain-containing protein n=1 Tax=Pseudomyxococcus hansupus TaxID=1297742 RepID=A0A0H4WPP1_9BACT|nr:DUF1993 domain-containing protein [Myxococcus hansupus]AKQ64739.1 hypothetical protein A176_001651 [Myxococcus hansupus]